VKILSSENASEIQEIISFVEKELGSPFNI